MDSGRTDATAVSAPASERNLLTNAAASWLGFVAQVAVAFILAPILVHGLGDHRYGIWALVESVLAYLMIFDLGVGASVVRYVARFESTRDREGLNRVFNTSLCIFAVAGLAALCVALSLAFPFADWLNIPAELAGEARWMLILLGFNLAVGLPLNVFPAALDGLGRYPIKNLIRSIGQIIRVPIFWLLLQLGGGLIELAVAITVCNLAEHLALALATRRYIPELRFSFAAADRATFRTIRGYSLDAFLVMLAFRVSFQTNALVIGAFLAPQFITFFAIAARLVEYAKVSMRSATIVLTPAVSSLEARGEHAAIRQVFVDGTRYVLWMILPIQLGLVVFGKPFLALWIGPDHAEQSYATLLILCIPLALTIAQSVAVRILYGIGRLRGFARLVLLEAAVNLALSILLVRTYGIEGVAWGTAIPSFVVSLVVGVYVCRLMGVSVGDYWRRTFLGPVLVTGLVTGVWVAATAWVAPTSWLALLSVGTACVAAYAVPAILVEFGPRSVARGWRGMVARMLGERPVPADAVAAVPGSVPREA